MDYRTQSIITISVIVVMLLAVGFSMGMIDNSITGAPIAPICKCVENKDCNDDNTTTDDVCVDKEDCEKAYCLNNQK
jgi:hypothetical protein